MKDSLKYILAVVLYGTNGLIMNYISFPSELVVFCRGSIGALVIYLFLKSRKQKINKDSIEANGFWLTLSGVSLGLNWIFLFAAYIKTTVAIASLCNYLAPVIVVVIAPFVLKEKIKIQKLFCVGGALLGIILVSGVVGGNFSGDNTEGIIYGLLAAAAFVMIVICNRKIKDINAFDKAFYQLLVSAIVILPFVIVKCLRIDIVFDFRSLLLTILLGVLQTGIAYCFYFDAMGKLPVTEIVILGYIEPVASVLLSFFVLHQPLTPLAWLGSALIVVSALLCELL